MSVIKMNQDEKPNDQIKPEDAMKMFQDKWNNMSTDQKMDTLLDMVLNAGFKLDMLATAVYTEPTMKEHLDSFNTKVKQEKENNDGSNSGNTPKPE